eukprot:4250692-Pleurochrysis_carterae.AAC.2
MPSASCRETSARSNVRGAFMAQTEFEKRWKIQQTQTVFAVSDATGMSNVALGRRRFPFSGKAYCDAAAHNGLQSLTTFKTRAVASF